MKENFIDNGRKQASHGRSGSAGRARVSRPIPAAFGPQKIRINSDTLIFRVLRDVKPILFFHRDILPDSAVLSRGYFNIFINQRKRKIGKSKISIPVLQKIMERVSNPDFIANASTFDSMPHGSDKNPAPGAEHLIPLPQIPFFPQNTATFGQKSSALNSTPRNSLQNRVFFSKISRSRQKSRFFLQNLVHLPMHRVLSSKIPCNCQKPRAFEKNLVQLPKIPCICQKPRAIAKNPVHFVPYQVLLISPGIVKSAPLLFSIQTHFYRIHIRLRLQFH